LVFELRGGGHLVGINGDGPGNGPKVSMSFSNNQEYFYFEEGESSSLDFQLINLGKGEARHIAITASSTHPYIEFTEDKIQVEGIDAGDLIHLESQFDFSFTDYSDSSFVGDMLFEIRVNDELLDTQKIMIFPTPASPYVKEDDLILLDGRTERKVPIYKQGPNIIEPEDISGGEGNGNGILEPNEKALVYIRLPQGMGPNDINTFHRTYLINHLDEPFISVKELNYQEKLNQAGATSVATVLTLSEDTPDHYEADLWFKVESLYNDKDDTTSNATIYAHEYDYRRVKLKLKE